GSIMVGGLNPNDRRLFVTGALVNQQGGLILNAGSTSGGALTGKLYVYGNVTNSGTFANLATLNYTADTEILSFALGGGGASGNFLNTSTGTLTLFARTEAGAQNATASLTVTGFLTNLNVIDM